MGRGCARAGLSALLLAVAGCEYWDNLIEEKQTARAELDLTVQDSWTGELLSDTYCMDRDRDSLLPPYDQGKYRFASVPTGSYSIRCEHEWYFDSTFQVDLTLKGARDTVRLVRRGQADWYPEPEKRVAIPGGDTLRLRFPPNLDWYATPSDDSGLFQYEWTFLRTPQLDGGHALANGQVPKESLAPRFHRYLPLASWMKEGADTVILNVRSLMKKGGVKNAYLVGSDTATVIWTRNVKPKIEFQWNGSRHNVGCPTQAVLEPLRFHFIASDSDGTCDSIHVWSADAPSLPSLDLRYSCSEKRYHSYVLEKPARPGRLQDDQEQYENVLYAEVMDDNRDTGLDTLTFTTYFYPPPHVVLRIEEGRTRFFTNEEIEFKLTASTKYNGFKWLELAWKGPEGFEDVSTHKPVDESKNEEDFRYSRSFGRPGAYVARGHAFSVCGATTEIDSVSFTVVKNTPPVITEIRPRGTADSGRIEFFLSATDSDATAGYDTIVQIDLRWSDGSSQVIDTLARSISHLPLQHKFSLAPGQTPSVEIYVFDKQREFGYSSYRFEIPASLPAARKTPVPP